MAKTQPLPPGTTRAEGTNGEVLFDGQFVTIKHSWTAPGGRGESRYPIGAVTGAEYKPGVITSIFTLVVSGGVQRTDAKKNRKGDPLSVEGSAKSRVGFIAMRDLILQVVADRDRAATASAPPQPNTLALGIGDQMTKLAMLHAQGALTAEEFTAAKAQLLGQPTGPQDAVPRPW